MKWLWGLGLAMMPFGVMAQGVPEVLSEQVQRPGYLDDLAVLIAGFGKNGAIDGQGLKNIVAMERADGRAMAMRRLQGADLNGDGAIGGKEIRVKAAALASAARGRLILYFGKADLDADDHVSVDELQAYANLVALQSFSEEKASRIYAILGFDQNGDGWVTQEEAKAAIALARSTHPSGEIDKKFKI